MPDARIPAPDLTIAEAFARLPQEAPERSAWPLLEQRLIAARPRPRPRWPFALAAAAVLAVAALVPRMMVSPQAPTPASPAIAATEAASLEALMSESAQLENFISAVASDDVASANATLLGLEFEERLQRLDGALTNPTLDPDSRRALWQRRVALLRDYAGVQGTTQWLAAEGSQFDGALVATF